MDSEEHDLAALGVLFVMVQENRKKSTKKRKQWCKKWLLRRNKSSDVQLLKEISDEANDFQNYLRMSENVYQKLLFLVSPFIKKNLPETRFICINFYEVCNSLIFLPRHNYCFDLF